MSGPSGRTIYKGKGEFLLEERKVLVDNVGFVIGGSGITPAYQIMREIYRDKDDKTRAYLLFANRTEEDVLLAGELEKFAEDQRFKIQFTVDKATSPDWKGYQGYITKNMMQQVFPPPSDKTLMTFCGNKGMRKLVFGLFEELQYNEDLIARF